MYKVTINESPIYEFITSLYTFVDPTGRKVTELGEKWVKKVRSQLDPWLENQLKEQKLEVLHRLNVLACHYTGEPRVPEFLAWLEGISPFEMEHYLQPWVAEIPMDIRELHRYVIVLLNKWDEQYFQSINPQILRTLEKDAQQKRQLLTNMEPVQFVEYCTNGLRLESEKIHQVVLIPQHHYTPYAIVDEHRGWVTCLYPVDLEEEGYLSKNVLRQIKGLSDKKRVHILQYLAQHEKGTFTAIQQYTGIVKSNLHYHLALLRTAGLIRAHHRSQRVEYYTLRKEGLDALHNQLKSYILGEPR